ncbi:MAG: ComF family protein [Gemmatimonadetes bacterium]|nr:MAG: ComF family protein [Gemmatimonadota bacterium]
MHSGNGESRQRMDARCSCNRAPRRSSGFSQTRRHRGRSCAPRFSGRSVLSAAVEQLLLPAECLLCHALLTPRDANRIVCPLCRQRWKAVRPPWCQRCGQPEPHFGPCRLCAQWPAALRSVRSASWLEEGARHAVHALKYGGLPRIADDLAAAMTGTRPPSDGPSALVPIPLAPKRLRERGYNQSDMLARALARQWRIPVLADLLVRMRETPTQTTLTPETRLANVAGAFTAGTAARWATLVLVDDVFTTGATLAEAARALEAAGARRLYGVTFARAAIPDFT